MENLSSWIWIVIAVLWFGAKILPRLLGGKSTETKMPPPQQPQAAEPAKSSDGPRADFDTLVTSLNRKRFAPQRGVKAPPPIEPK
jgi:hypothetical protein